MESTFSWECDLLSLIVNQIEQHPRQLTATIWQAGGALRTTSVLQRKPGTTPLGKEPAVITEEPPES